MPAPSSQIVIRRSSSMLEKSMSTRVASASMALRTASRSAFGKLSYVCRLSSGSRPARATYRSATEPPSVGVGCAAKRAAISRLIGTRHGRVVGDLQLQVFETNRGRREIFLLDVDTQPL